MIEESSSKKRIFFHKGDVVKLRVYDMSEPPEMKVQDIVWETNQDGSLLLKPTQLQNGQVVNNKVLKGVICGWYSEYIDPFGNRRKGEYIEKLFDTRDLVKISKLASYYLELAVNKLSEEGKYDLVKQVNNVINSL